MKGQGEGGQELRHTGGLTQTSTGAVIAECRGEWGREWKGRLKVIGVREAGPEICRRRLCPFPSEV